MRWSVLLLLCALALAACQNRLRVPQMRFEGNENLLDSDLVESADRYLRRFVAKGRRPADADDAAFAMQTAYREEGYAEAEVTFTLEQGDLVFHVQEGLLTKFGQVRFEGVQSLPATELAKHFEFEGSGFFSLGPVLLDPQLAAAAVSAVESDYHRAGFLRVEVEDPEIVWNAERTEADVLVRVEEGKRYSVSSVTVTGAERALIGTPEPVGGPYMSTLPARLSTRLRRALRNEGYAFAEVTASAEVDDESATARIRVEAERGEPIRLDEIRIHGNGATREGFMRKRFSMRRGDVIRREHLEDGVASLYRSRLFQTVQAKLVPTTPGRADLRIDVTSADTKRLDLEVGYGSWDQLYGAFEYKDFNLFGHGRILRVSGLASFKSYGGEVQVEDPWILGQDNRLWITLGAMERQEQFYDYTALNAEVAAQRRFDRHQRIWGGYRFRVEEARNLSAVLPPEELEKISGFQRSAGPYVRYRIDYRDDLFMPTKGWFAEAAALWSTPVLGASLSYLELDVRASYYVNLSSWGVLALGASTGSRSPYGGTTMPIQQRYFLGGQLTVRSFDQDELTPTDGFGNGIGGLTYAWGGAEWRMPLFDIVHGALFVDVGQVSLDSWAFDGEVGYGVGGGLRLYTPVGPVRADVAYNPGPLLAAKQRWQFHFSFGFTF